MPQFYLAGFTSDGTKEGWLYATALATGKQWRCKPAGVAHSRDYFRVDVPEQDPFVIERSFAQLEGEMATALRTVIETQNIPSGDTYSLLMHLVALSLARVPVMRENTGRPMVQIAEMVLQMTLSSPERYYSTLENMKKDGHDVSNFPSFEEMEQKSNTDHFTITPSQNWNVHSALMIADIILELLPKRDWSLVVPKRPEDIFICSDNPVSVSWTVSGLERQPPGLGLKNTMVFMPLSSHLGLIGLFGPVNPKISIESSNVAMLNQLTFRQAMAQIYCRDESFLIRRNNRMKKVRVC